MSDRIPAQGPLEARLVEELAALRAFARRLVGATRAASEGEDVVQETLSRALHYRASFDEERALGPWLRRTALRAWLDMRARAERGSELLESEPAAAPACDALAERDQVEHVLRPLSSIEREVVLKFHRDGQSVLEVAAALGLPEGTVKSHLYRARRKLAEEDEA